MCFSRFPFLIKTGFKSIDFAWDIPSKLEKLLFKLGEVFKRVLGAVLEASWSGLGGVLGGLGGVLGGLGAVLGGSWGGRGGSWTPLGRSWSGLGAILRVSGAFWRGVPVVLEAPREMLTLETLATCQCIYLYVYVCMYTCTYSYMYTYSYTYMYRCRLLEVVRSSLLFSS